MLCDAHTVQEQHSFISILLTIIFVALFLFDVCHYDTSIPFLVCLYIVCVNNLKWAVLSFPYRTSAFTQPWHQKDLIVFTMPLNLTKLNISLNSFHLHDLVVYFLPGWILHYNIFSPCWYYFYVIDNIGLTTHIAWLFVLFYCSA